MKAKLLTLALFGIMSFSFMSCNEEEVAPVKDGISIQQQQSDCECEGGVEDREEPGV